MEQRHELPTHLGVEDHVIGDFSMRQLLLLLSGLASAYAAWSQIPVLPLAARGALATTVLLLTLALALVRPGDRGLDVWALAILRYCTRPRVTVWRPCLPVASAERHLGADWVARAPHLAWADAASAAAPPRSDRSEVAR